MLKLFKKITISNRNLFIIQVCLHFFLQVSFPSELPLQAFLKFINNQGHYKKIRIGYVLKSADVRTQVCSRYSENSSHTYPCRAHPHIPTHNRAHPHTPAHTHTHPCTPPHIPAHGLNLINHMKLHVNRPNTKKARKEKGRSKSPLNHFSGLKIDICTYIYI